MEGKTKRLIFFLGALFVAIIFLTSYAAFSSNNLSNSSTSTVKAKQTVFARGSSNAVIVNYSSIANITMVNSSNITRGTVANVVSQLQANGLVQSYTSTNSTYQLALSGISPYNLSQMLDSEVRQPNSLRVGGTALVMLPQNISLFYGAPQPADVFLRSRNYSVNMSRVRRIGTTINVSISALIAADGSVYNNQIRVSYSGG